MPCLNIQSSKLQQDGPLIEVLIAPSSALRKELEDKDHPVPAPIKKIFQIDTGASASMMKIGIAKELGLLPKGTTNIRTASNEGVACFTYDVDLLLYEGRTIHNVLICEGALAGQNIDGLLGRDVLRNALFVYSGFTNQFTLAV